jgi:hypothetical protein
MLTPDLAHTVDLEVRIPHPLYVGLQGRIALCPGGQFGGIGALCCIGMVGARAIGRTRQIGSTP